LDKDTITLLVGAVCAPLVVYIAYLRIKMFNSPDGERYLKRRMQGPFVALSDEEVAEDEARKSRLKAGIE
jgi:hypothetical protein